LSSKAIVLDDLSPVDHSPDPDDNFILAAAVAAKADLIVSGDKNHVLDLGEVEGIPIVSPREALERLVN
jgi:predicted nucleic acid-binding protein